MGMLDWFLRSAPPAPAHYRDDRADPLDRLMTLIDAQGQRLSVDGMDLPQIFSFANLVQGANKSYLHGYQDEARRHSIENAKAMWRDPLLKGLLNERKRGVMSCKWHLEPDNARDPWQKATADCLTKILKNIPRWRRIRWQLLNAIWYGKYAVQVHWDYKYMDLPFPALNGPAGPGVRPSTQMQRVRVFTARKTKPKNGDSIGWMHDDTPYIQVYGGWRHPGAEIVSVGGQSQGLVLKGTWRNRFVIHQHECEDAEFFDGDQAARHLGIGIRDELYWYDFVRRDYMSWVTKTLQRWGLGIIYIEYDYGNKASKDEAQEAAKRYSPGKSVLLVPRSWEQGRTSEGIKILEIPTAGMELLTRLQEKWEKVMERFVIGQHMSAGDDNSDGLGGTGRANFAKTTKAEVIEDDAENLAETLTGDDDNPGFVNMIYKHTFQETQGYDFPCPRLVFQTEDEDVDAKMNAITQAAQYVPIKTDSLYDAIGEPRPEEGDETFGGPQMPVPAVDKAGGPEEAEPTDPFASLFTDFQQAAPTALYASDQPQQTTMPRPAQPRQEIQRPVNPSRPATPPPAQRPATAQRPPTPPAVPRQAIAARPSPIPTQPPAQAPPQSLTSTDHIRRMVQPHVEDAQRLASRPFDEQTPGQMVSWLRSMHDHPNVSTKHLHAIADHFGVQAGHLADRGQILYRIGEAMRDRTLAGPAGPAEEQTPHTPQDEPFSETLDDESFPHPTADWEENPDDIPMALPVDDDGVEDARRMFADEPVAETLDDDPVLAPAQQNTPQTSAAFQQPQTQSGREYLRALEGIANEFGSTANGDTVRGVIARLRNGDDLNAGDVAQIMEEIPGIRDMPTYRTLLTMADAEDDRNIEQNRPSPAQPRRSREERQAATIAGLAQHWGVKSTEEFRGLVGRQRDGDIFEAIPIANGKGVELNLHRKDGTHFEARIGNHNGKKIMDVHGFFQRDKEKRGHGFGRDDMKSLYDQATKLGISKIETFGARGANMIGYDLWPKMGFDGKLDVDSRRRMPANLRSAKTLQELYATPGGAEWWNEHGDGMPMTLKLSGDSAGTQRFLEYIGMRRSPERAARKEARRQRRENQK